MNRTVSRRHFLVFLASAFVFPSCSVFQPKKSTFVCKALEERNLDQEMDKSFRVLAATESPFSLRRAALKAKGKYGTVYIGKRFIDATVLSMVSPEDFLSDAHKKPVPRLLTLEDWLSSSKKELVQYTAETRSMVEKLLARDFVIRDDFSIHKEMNGDYQAFAFSRDEFSDYKNLNCLFLRIAQASISQAYIELLFTDVKEADRKEVVEKLDTVLILLSKWNELASAILEEPFCPNETGVVKHMSGENLEELFDELLKEVCDNESSFWKLSEKWNRLVD